MCPGVCVRCWYVCVRELCAVLPPYFIFMSRPSDLGAEARLVLTGCVPVCVIRLKVLVLRKRMGASSE